MEDEQLSQVTRTLTPNPHPPTHNREPYDTRIVLSNIMFL